MESYHEPRGARGARAEASLNHPALQMFVYGKTRLGAPSAPHPRTGRGVDALHLPCGHRAGRGRYYAEIPTLPGCHSWGYSYQEALKNIKEALELWLEVNKEAGETIPLEEPRTILDADVTVGVLA